MKRIIATLLCVSAAIVFVSFTSTGCGGPSNEEEVKQMATPPPTNNPEVQPPPKSDMDMADDPKRLKGKGPRGGGPD